jgi:hypothetical protein
MKRILLSLLITPVCYCNTIIKESFLRKIICAIFPCTRSKDRISSSVDLMRLTAPTPSVRKRYSKYNSLNLNGCTPITKEFKDYVKSRHLQVPANE